MWRCVCICSTSNQPRHHLGRRSVKCNAPLGSSSRFTRPESPNVARSQTVSRVGGSPLLLHHEGDRGRVCLWSVVFGSTDRSVLCVWSAAHVGDEVVLFDDLSLWDVANIVVMMGEEPTRSCDFVVWTRIWAPSLHFIEPSFRGMLRSCCCARSHLSSVWRALSVV